MPSRNTGQVRIRSDLLNGFSGYLPVVSPYGAFGSILPPHSRQIPVVGGMGHGVPLPL